MQTKEIKLPLDLIKGILITLSALFLLLTTSGQVDISREEGQITSRTFPYMIFGILLVCGVLFLLRGAFGKGEKKMVVLDREAVRAWAVPIGVLLIVAGYIFLMGRVGYVLSSLLAVAVVLAFLRCRKWYYYAICAGAVFAIYFIFTRAIQVQLPGLPF